MITGQIYMIKDTVTERAYIGRSQNPQRRIYQHFLALRRGCHAVEDMQADFNAHADGFTAFILSEAEPTNPRSEIEMMEKYRTCVRGEGYNYKDTHVTSRDRNAKKRSVQTKLCLLCRALDDNQATYAYTLLRKLFGDAEDETI